MAQNNRVFYPIHAVGFAPLGTEHATTGLYTAAKGVQSFSMDTSFNLEQVFQLGQLDLYENIEDIPNIEVTVDKVIDGYALLEHLATPSATAASLNGRFSDEQAMMLAAYYRSTVDQASGNPLNYVLLSGVYVSSINWNIPVQGNITESISLVCNDKEWFSSPSGTPWTVGSIFSGEEGPVAPVASGGVQRRENVVMASSLWPTEIPGINVSGFNTEVSGAYSAHIQNVTVGVSLNRTDLFELGRRGPYFRYAEFPTEVTCSIEITATEDGDSINAKEESVNLSDQTIVIDLTQGVQLNLGNKNKLQSISQAGGDTGGGNVTVTYNYSNFNNLTVTMPATDPAGLTP